SPITFEGFAQLGGGINYGESGSTTISGVTFSSAPSVLLQLVNLGDSFFYHTGSVSGGAVLQSFPQFGVPSILKITLPGVYSAIGFDSNASMNAVVNVTLSDGTAVSYSIFEDPVGPTTGQFFGFTSSTGITSLTLSGVIVDGNRSKILNIDDFRFGQANTISPVPEPASGVSLAISIAIVLFTHQKRSAWKFSKTSEWRNAKDTAVP